MSAPSTGPSGSSRTPRRSNGSPKASSSASSARPSLTGSASSPARKTQAPRRSMNGSAGTGAAKGAPAEQPRTGKEGNEAPPQAQPTSSSSSSGPWKVGVTPFVEGALDNNEEQRAKHIVFLDIDNTLYKKSTRIAHLMTERIRSYILKLGLTPEEADRVHHAYYKEYGLAIRGLVRHHKIDPLDYDQQCDASLPLDRILRPDPEVIGLLTDLDRTKCRVWALTNAYKTHAMRVLRLLELDQLVEGVIYCDYEQPDFVCKPEEEYYRSALEILGVPSSTDCYFVDDSALNIRAAKAMGWRSCVLFQEPEAPSETASASQRKEQTGSSSTEDAAAASVDERQLTTNPFSPTYVDEEALRAQFDVLPPRLRTRVLEVLIEASTPEELAPLRNVLNRRLLRPQDMMTGLTEALRLRIFERLEVPELLRCRQVSKRWNEISRHPDLWRSHALALTEGDPEPVQPPSDPSGWEALVKGLYFRERNWRHGIAQRIDFLKGHTGFVTALKLKGSRTLVTGSYDETIRVWNVQTAKCEKVLKAKAISCLDFLLDEGILCAGLYDTGRVMVWDMKNWQLLQTLSGHNRGIRNVALSKDYLVSVGQDKAIVVWDWRSGQKIVRFGQQSNVSLGISIVDRDKIVAVTVDGILRTFSITNKEMIGQFSLGKLAAASVSEDSAAEKAQMAAVGGDANMLQWFAAHRNTVTVASRDKAIHLQWREHVVPVAASRPSKSASPASPLSPRTPTARLANGGSGTKQSSPTSSIKTSGSVSSFGSSGRSRRDSLESNASAMTATSTATSRRTSIAGTPSRSGSVRRAGATTPSAGIAGRKSLDGRAPALTPLKTSGKATTPAAENEEAAPSIDSALSAQSSSGAARAEPAATRVAPHLGVAPLVVDVVSIPDSATGCIDPAKRRVVSASRFSSRAGADLRLYASTVELGSDGLESRRVVPVGGAWQAMASELAQPNRNPMSIAVDHESAVVGTSDGLVYRISFVGSEYHRGWVDEEEEGKRAEEAASGKNEAQEVEGPGDAVIANLVELRSVWKDLMLPDDAPRDHPGRVRRDLVKAIGLK